MPRLTDGHNGWHGRVINDNPLEEPEVADADHGQVWPRGLGCFGHQLRCNREREYRATVEPVVMKVTIDARVDEARESNLRFRRLAARVPHERQRIPTRRGYRAGLFRRRCQLVLGRQRRSATTDD